MLYELPNDEHTSAVIYASTGITLVVFIIIITYHSLQKLYLMRSGSKLREFLRAGLNRLSNNNGCTLIGGYSTIAKCDLHSHRTI